MLETRKLMIVLAEQVNAILSRFSPGKGFALIAFDFNIPGKVNYISNAERKTMIEAFKTAAIQIENGQEPEHASLKDLQDDNKKEKAEKNG